MPTIADVRAKYPQYKDLSDDQLAQGMHRKFYSDMPFEEFAKRIQYSPAIPAPDVNALDVGGSMIAQASEGTGDVLGSMARVSQTPAARIGSLVAPMAFGPPDLLELNAKAYGMVGDFLKNRSADVREFAGQAASAITSAVGFGDETAEDVYRRTSADTPEMERSRKENVITGDITSPSTVSLGTNPTMIGMATNIGDTAARMAPVIVGARINPLLGVTAGGMQGYEGARTEESDRITNLPREQIVAMPRFRELVAEETGKPFEEGYADISAASSRLFDGPGTDEDKAIAAAGSRALQRLKDEAGNASGWASVPLGMLQGLIFTGKIGKALSTSVRGSSTGVVGAARAAAGTATGMTAAALGEAATEVGQKVSSAYGSTLATGEQGRNLTEDTAADAILGGAMGAGTNVSLPKPKVIDKVFGGEGIKAGDVLGEVGDEDAPAPGPPPTPGPMPPRARAGYTFDENGNIIEQGGGLVPVGPSPVAPESPGYGMGPLGPLQSDAANPNFMVDPQGSASAPGDWRAREQARRAQSGGPGMGPAVNGDPTMPEADMAQAAFDSSIEAMQLAIGRKPTKASMSATAATIATRFGVDPAALIARHAQKPAASVEPVTTPPNPASVAVPVPVVPPTVRTVGVHPNAPQEAPAPVPTGKMWRRGKSALAVQTADGTWFVRVKRGTQWQAWQKRETFDPSGAFGYSPYTPPSGNVRINGKVHAVGERRSEAKQAKAPPDVIDSIIAAGGLNREEMRKHGIDPRMFGTRRGATKWVFPRNGGMTLDALRQRLIDDGYFPPEDPDAPPTISNDDAFEIVQRALNQGERIVSTTHAGAEAAYQEARNAIEAGSIDAMDAEAASDYLSRIEGDEIARGVFDQLDPDEDVEGMSLNELVERALAAGVTPQEMRKAYDLYGFDGEPTAEPVAARNLWELIRTKEKDNGAITRTRSADRGNGPAPAPQEPATVGNAAQRPETNGNEGGTVGRDQPEGGDAAREQAGVERRTGSDRSAVDALPANERDAEIQRLRAENAELQRQLDTDPLTGVLSRAAYERDIQNARGVATIDLKQFKGYNTVGGQTGGDLVLKAFAKAMKDAESDGVRAYRPGGDEFAFLSADNEQSARDAADRLQQFAADIRLSLGKDGVTYSIEGVPFTAGIGHDAESADTNLSANKGDYDRNALPESIRRTDQGDVGSGNEADGDGRNAAERDVQGPADPLTLTDNTVVTPPRAQRPASQSGLFGPVTDIDRQRLRFERDKPKPEKTDTVDIEDAINQTPPTGGVSVSTPTEGDRNAQKPDVDTSASRNAQADGQANPASSAQADVDTSASRNAQADGQANPASSAQADAGTADGATPSDAAGGLTTNAAARLSGGGVASKALLALSNLSNGTYRYGDGFKAAIGATKAGDYQGALSALDAHVAVATDGSKMSRPFDGGINAQIRATLNRWVNEARWHLLRLVEQKTPEDFIAAERAAMGIVDAAASEAAASPENDKPEPTEAQKEAGNYAKGHVRVHGLDFAIETPAGTSRRPEWPPLANHYGYIKRTEGADGEHVDVFFGPRAEDETAPVFVVDQFDPKSGKFDEHKVMLGFSNELQARTAYLANYAPGWKGMKSVTRMSIDDFKSWLRDGDLKQPVANIPEKATPTKRGNPQAPEKIADFGEKIGGARKDVWSSFKDQLREVSDDNVLTEPLSKTWPLPDYQKMIDDGADPWVVAFIRSARDEIPRKPNSTWKQKNWAMQVKQLRDVSLKLLNGDISTDRAKELLAESRGLRVLASRIELYQLVGHAQSLAGVSFEEHHYSLYKGRENVRMWVVEKATAATAFSNWPRELATGDTKEQMLQAFKEKVASLQLNPEKAKVAAFDIYSYQRAAGYFIGKKVGRNHIDLAGPFPTVGEARAYRDANNAALVAKLEASKEIPNERRETNEPRVGEDMRNGHDVTPQMFGDAFGFKGVEFGNWVEQTKRQSDLNEAFDALMDMAAILGIPPKAISLNGQLGIAFGARGSGGVKPAAAHYEPGKVVINLTKKNGAGSLGHEWWHALDNYFQRMRGKSEYATEALDVSLASRGSRFVEDAKMRKEMVEAFGAVVSAIKLTAIKARSAKLDAKRTKEYWTTGREMSARAFESYLITKLQDQNASNDYLANIVDEATWSAAEKLGWELDQSYPYPTAGEIPAISAAFDRFFNTIEARETPEGRIELASVPGWESVDVDTDRLPDEAIEREVAKARSEFGDAVTIEVMDSIQDAPASDQTKKLYPGANGLTDGKSRVWIFRRGLQSLQALRTTLAHEIIGHIGVERVIGADWPAVMDSIKRIREGKLFASPAVVNAIRSAESRYPGADDLTFAREAVAIMAERGITGALWDRIVAAVRRYLRKVFGSLQWNENEIRDLLRRAGDSVRSKPAVFRGAEFEAAQVVFHGTPHNVDRFRMSKIGTGEGNQAYGWGVYFASRRGVADFYRDALTGASVKFASEETKNKLLSGDADRAIAFARGQIKEGGSISSVIEETRQGARNFRDRKPTSYRREGPDLAMAAAFDAVADALESGDLVIEKEKGNLYSVEAPEDSDLLDWDKPLSEQPEKVREALRPIIQSAAKSFPSIAENDSVTGKGIYTAYQAHRGGSAQEASEAMLAAGIPGLRYLDGTSRNKGEGSHNYVIWSEEAIGEPTMLASNPEPAKPFFSALVRSIDEAKGAPKRANADAWSQWLDGAQRRGAFKQSERDWLGVDAWLDGRDSTTREELAEFVRANQVEVQETVLGEGGSDMQAVLDEYAEDIFDQPFDDLSADEQARVESEAAEDSRLKYSDPTKFSGYQLPGGQNYRELLLTMPVSTTLPDGFSLKQIEAGPRKGQWAVLGPGPLAENRYGSGATQAEAIANFGAHGHNGPTYKSSHFDQPNILAHVRFNERTDADGKRVLFVEEVQSDWHQAGRKHGYVGTTRSLKEIVADMDAVTRELRARTGRYASEDGDWESNSDLMTRRDALDAEGASARSSKAGGVPDAPLKREWPLTAMKRMIRYAADNGFDRIAWTTGEQQAERYDLSKQVDSILYAKNPDGTYRVSVMVRNEGKQVGDRLTESELEDQVGKEIAAKIVAGDGKRREVAGKYDPVSMTSRKDFMQELSGVDLKVGGEGMKAFYDKMLPNELGKYVKKWGAKVGSARIKTGDELKKFLPQQYDDEFGIDDSILDARVPGLSFKTYDEAEARASEMNGVGTLVHAVDITPSMREAAMQGQPLFSNPAQGPIERQMAEDARAGQPIDKLFRLPFHLFGLDSHGRLKPGTKLYDWLTRVVAEKMPAEDGAFGWAIPYITAARAGLIDRYGVPSEFVKRDEQRQSEVRAVLMHAARVANDLEGLTTAEAKVLQAMLTGHEIPAGELGKLSQPIKEAIDQMGREAVEMGLISPEAYARNRGAYLHRSYLKYEADRSKLGKFIGNLMDKRRKKLMGDTLRGRGMTMDRDAESVARALGGEVKEGDIVTVLRQKTETGVRTKYQRGPLNGAPPVGWESLGDWRAMGVKGKKATLWRDFTPEEREKMGEILDARYNIVKTFSLMSHDLATGKFLRDIAANPEWATKELPEGASFAEAGGRYETYSDRDWVRVPDAVIPGTNDGKGKPVKRWGALAGMYVRAPIWRDLNQLQEMQNPQLWSSTWKEVLRIWKMNKTARNPVVHMNNVMSNLMFMDLADIRLRDLYAGIGAYRRGEKDADYRDAMAHGAFGGGFADQELKRKVLDPILDKILREQKQDQADTVEGRAQIMVMLGQLWDLVKRADGRMLDAYGAEDEIFRLAFYLRRQSLGDTPEEAARAARRQFIDYDIRAPWVNMARNTLLPFIGYTYRSIPLLAQAIAERPWKLAKYATLAAAANWFGYWFWDEEDDEETDRKVMAPQVQGTTWVGSPRMIRMPWHDGDGNPVFLDVRRWIPAGDVFDTNQSEMGMPAWLQFGGPLMLAGEYVLNKQAFTRKPIVDPLTDTTTEKAGKTVSWAWKAFMPNAPWIPESYSWDKLQQAATGATDDLGRDYSALEASASVLGIKAAGHDVDLQRRYRAMDFDRHERELDFEISALKREMSKKAISRERFDANLAKIIAKKKLLNDERRRVLSR